MSLSIQEDQHTEFKENPKSGTIVNEIVAFLNTCDGELYIGVKDDGTVVGIPDISKASLDISNIIADHIEPNPRNFVTLDTPIIDGKRIIRINVKKGNRLYYIKKFGMSSAGCFERIGTSCRGMTNEQISKRMMESYKSTLKITNLPADKKDLTFKMIRFLYAQEGLTVQDSNFLKNEGFLDDEGHYNIQAELLADENRFSIKVVRFEGNDKGSRILLRNEYGYQCLIVAMKNAQNYCAEVINQTKTVFHENGYREDIPLFDRDAFREAWYNACLHNDWVEGTPPAIYVFNNRLEIISTGGLPSNMTKEDFFGGVSNPVNESLAQMFIKLGLIEQTGHGVAMIVDKYGKEAFTFLDHFLRVTIPFSFDLNSFLKTNVSENVQKNNNVSENVQNVSGNVSENIQNVSENVSENIQNASDESLGQNQTTEEKLIEAILRDPTLTTSDLAKIVGKTRRTVSRIVNCSSKISRIGPDKGGRWEIKK